MMQKIVLLVVGICSSFLLYARTLPNDVVVGVYKAGSYPEITIIQDTPKMTVKKFMTLGMSNKKMVLRLPVSVRILDEQNRFITWGRLPQHMDKAIAVQFNGKNEAAMIWILSPEERMQQLELAKKRSK